MSATLYSDKGCQKWIRDKKTGVAAFRCGELDDKCNILALCQKCKNALAVDSVQKEKDE